MEIQTFSVSIVSVIKNMSFLQLFRRISIKRASSESLLHQPPLTLYLSRAALDFTFICNSKSHE